MPLLAALFNLILPGAGYLFFTKKKLFGAGLAVAGALFAVELVPIVATLPPAILVGWIALAVTTAIDGFAEASTPVPAEELLRDVDGVFTAGADPQPRRRQDAIEKLLAENGLSAIQVVAQKTIDNGLDTVVIVAGRPAPKA